MLKGIEETAAQTIELIKQISTLMMEYKNILRPLFGQQYKHELINNLFYHPYTKIEFMQNDMMVQRKTASKYLDKIVEVGLLQKVKLGHSNYYINTKLMNLFINYHYSYDNKIESIESVHE
jgi:Fic family protein